MPGLNSVQVHIYVINLINNTNRRQDMTEQLLQLGLTEDQFELITTHKPIQDDIINWKKQGFIAPNCIPGGNRKSFKYGEVGHYMAYADIFEDAIAKRYDNILILEDDAILSPCFFEEIYSVLRDLHRKRWDVISLSWAKSGENFGRKFHGEYVIPQEISAYESKGVFIGTEAMIFNRKAVDRVYDKMFPMMFQTDKFLDMLKSVGYITLLAPKKGLTYQNPKYHSDIQ